MPTEPIMNSSTDVLKTHQQVYETALHDLTVTDEATGNRAKTPIYQKRAAAAEGSSNRALADAAEALSAIWRRSGPYPHRIRAKNQK
ncbi:MAG TPA: hypothetical protein VF011_22345 [Terriglobales bacterium]